MKEHAQENAKEKEGILYGTFLPFFSNIFFSMLEKLSKEFSVFWRGGGRNKDFSGKKEDLVKDFHRIPFFYRFHLLMEEFEKENVKVEAKGKMIKPFCSNK